jgi:hypothetical protein
MKGKLAWIGVAALLGAPSLVWSEKRDTVTSPAGTQEVTARRQETQLFAGDDPEPYQKKWSGTIEKRPEGFVIVTRRHTFGFTNADGFHDELQSFVSKEVAVTGLWRVDRIEIQKIEPGRSR